MNADNQKSDLGCMAQPPLHNAGRLPPATEVLISSQTEAIEALGRIATRLEDFNNRMLGEEPAQPLAQTADVPMSAVGLLQTSMEHINILAERISTQLNRTEEIG